MGEIAEAILDGLLCEGCGELIDGEESGYRRLCGGCLRAWIDALPNTRTHPYKKFQCTSCQKFFATDDARMQHAAAKHPIPQQTRGRERT